ncbi:MAG: energy transducer TonB [Oscillatoriales cyanobacterium C42_A2020_001]|nr:energy transducer TonB [Leptolyngbyaceae cyanobacterium C42_A2020_001]
MITAPVQQPPNLKPRRHTDPPILWIAVLAGSLVINGVGALSFQRALQPMKPVQAAFTPISVSFVSRPSASSALKRKSTRVKQALAQTTPSTSSNQTSRLSASTTSLARDAISYASTKPRSRPSSKVSPKSPSKVTPPPAAPFNRQPHDQTSAEETGSASHSQSESTNVSAPVAPLSPSDDPVTSGVLLPSVPNVPDPSRSRPETLANAPTRSFVLDQKPLPTQFLAELKILPESGDRLSNPELSDASESPVRNQEQLTKTLTSSSSQCLLLPEALREFNQPVVLSVSLDETGRFTKATPVSVQNSSGNNSYDALAVCALKTWRSIPETAIAGYADPSNLKVQLTLKVVGKAN